MVDAIIRSEKLCHLWTAWHGVGVVNNQSFWAACRSVVFSHVQQFIQCSST